MINEEITQRDINLAIRVGSIAAGELRKALEKLLAKLTERPPDGSEPALPEQKHGKQTLLELQKHGDGLNTIALNNPNLRALYDAMKKNGIDFAAVKDGKGRYTLFFKGKDVDTVTHAIRQYTQKLVKIQNRPTIGKALTAAKKLAQSLNNQLDKVKNKTMGAR